MNHLYIIVQCQKGNQAAWESFIKAYGPLAQKIVRKYFPLAVEDVENITQNVFIKLYEGGLVRFRGTTLFEFRAYYKTIVLNETKTYLQKENRWKNKIEYPFLVSDETEENHASPSENGIDHIAAETPNPDRIAVGKEATEIVDKILGNYSLKERQLFLLKLKGYKEKEISQIMGIPMGSVASSYSRMVEKVKEALYQNGLKSI